MCVTNPILENSIYQYPANGYSTARVVEETVEETFDEDGKLISRTKKTVTRYEGNQPYYQWYSGDANPPSFIVT